MLSCVFTTSLYLKMKISNITSIFGLSGGSGIKPHIRDQSSAHICDRFSHIIFILMDWVTFCDISVTLFRAAVQLR